MNVGGAFLWLIVAALAIGVVWLLVSAAIDSAKREQKEAAARRELVRKAEAYDELIWKKAQKEKRKKS